MPIDANIRYYIKENGHIKINDMMKEVLSNNHESYYRSTKHIGENGDFITAPEISQLFGEIIALWAIEKWIIIGCPQEFALVELGPGTGSLMQDFLRVAKLHKEFFSAIRIFLYEINPFFLASQETRIFEYDKKISWIKNIQELPNLPAIIIANEFFDALPIKQYLKVDHKWFERILVVDPIDSRIKFCKIEVNKNLQNQLLSEYKSAYDGAVIEESVESLHIVRNLSDHIKKYKGAALIIDYGYIIHPVDRLRSQYNSTLQAVKNHQYSSILDTLGEADLTTHVDFYALSKAAREQNIHQISLKTQREFLLKYGIELRLSTLKNSLSCEDFIIIQKQVHRLIAQEQMGELFKVLEIYVEKSST